MKLKNSYVRALSVCLAFVFLLGITGCGSTSKASRGWILSDIVAEPNFDDLMNAIMDVRSSRMVKEGLAGDAVLLTAVTELAPKSRRLLTICSMLYVAYGLLVEDEDPDYAKELYSIGESYGWRAIKRNGKIRKGLEKGEKLHALVKHAKDEDIDAVLFLGANIGLKLFLSMDDLTAIMAMADVIALFKKALELDPEYFFGFGKLFMALYCCMMPTMIDPDGGPENALKWFEKVEAQNKGNFLVVDAFKARFYATLIKDEEMFDRLIKRTLETDSSVMKGGYLLNEVAKIKARVFLKEKYKWF
ncbi:MAG: TRAP transporter TatT component family protein [Spirochaetota bacterium]|nr:TRAP transporter TatT component family protein [Spirochaetota bacterium]